MTPAQIELLQKLIQADREYWVRRVADEAVALAARGVEVGWINGVNPRTAKTLVDAGLAEMLDMGNGLTCLFLGRYNPFSDAVESGTAATGNSIND